MKTSRNRTPARLDDFSELGGALGFLAESNGDMDNAATASPPPVTLDGSILTVEAADQLVEAAAPVEAPKKTGKKKGRKPVVIAIEDSKVEEVEAAGEETAIGYPAPFNPFNSDEILSGTGNEARTVNVQLTQTIPYIRLKPIVTEHGITFEEALGAHEDSAKAELLRHLNVEPTSKTAILIELLKATDIADLLADYGVTFANLDAQDAEEYAEKFVKKIMSSPLATATDKIVKKHTAELVAIAQKLETVLKHDVVINKLTADQFQIAAIAAINDSGILRAAVLELGRVLELQNINPNQTVASLPQLVAIIRHAATRVDVVTSAATRLKAQHDKDRATNDALRAELEKQIARNEELARDMAALIDARNVIPEGLSTFPILITDGQKRFLSRTDGKGRKEKLKPSKLAWLTTADKAVSFKTETGARKAAEQFILKTNKLWQRISEDPEGVDVSNLMLAGVPVENIRYAKHGVIVSNH